MNNDISPFEMLTVPMVEGALLVLMLIILIQAAFFAKFVDRCQAEFVGYLRDLARTAEPNQSGGSFAMTIDGIELQRVPTEKQRFKPRKSTQT
jgi:hypothetical protein